MTEQEHLIRAILANPRDDTARVVYADWVEERAGVVHCHHCGGGRPGEWMFAADESGRCLTCRGSNWVSDGLAERAKLIRVQCDIAKHLSGHGLLNVCTFRRGCSCPFHELRKAEKALIEWVSLSAGVYPRLSVLVGHDLVRYDRGFVFHATSSLAVVEELLRSLGPEVLLVKHAGAVDCRPLNFEGRFLWHNAGHPVLKDAPPDAVAEPDWLPPRLFDRLTGYLPRHSDDVTRLVKSYRSTRAARRALSAAILAESRAACGLQE